MTKNRYHSGYTLLEIVVTLAIIAALAAIAIPIYRNHIAKSAATDIVAKHEELRTVVNANAAVQELDSCSDVLRAVSPAFLQDKFANLVVDFVAVKGGYGPVLRVCTEAATHGNLGIQAAKKAHDQFAQRNLADPDAVIGESMVAFTVPLTTEDVSVCTDYQPVQSSGTGCGGQTLAGSPPKPAPAPPPKPAPAPPPKQPDNVTSTGIKCKDWEYVEGANCKLKPEYRNLTITEKPTMANNPCPTGYHFQPADGQVFSGSAQKGTCETSGNHPNPYEPVTCEVCSGPPRLCDRLHHSTQCVYPNNYCVNNLTNLESGARDLERRCGNREEATLEWFHGSSDNDRCQTLDPKFVQTLKFECFYACVTDNCNLGINPIVTNKDSMWNPY